MAARLNRLHQDSVRKKIQASQLVRVLQDEALGRTELADGQRESAKFLLNKSLGNPPEQQEVNLIGDISLSVAFVASRTG